MRIGQTSIVHFASQIVASALGFLVTVYLAREVGEAVLGNYFLVLAVLVWLKVLGGQGIQTALRKRLSEGTAPATYLGAGLLLQIVALIILTSVLIVVRAPLNQYLRTNAALSLVAALIAGLFFWQVRAALEGRHFVGISALLSPLDRLLRSAFQIGIVLIGFGAVEWLLSGYALAQLLVAAVGFSILGISPQIPTQTEVWNILEYARYSWFSGFESRAFASMDTLILGVFSIPSSFIGVYAVAWNLASILAIFGVSISTTLFPTVSEFNSKSDLDSADTNTNIHIDNIEGLINDSLAYAGLFIIPGLIGCIVVGHAILTIYGPAFTEGYIVLIMLVFARLVYTYESQFTSLLNALDHPEATLRVNAVFVVTNLISNIALVSAIGWFGAALATTLSAIVGLVYAYVSLRRYAVVSIPFIELRNQILAAGLMGVVLLLTRDYVAAEILWTGVLVGGGAAIYFLTLSGLSSRFRTTVARNLPVDR